MENKKINSLIDNMKLEELQWLLKEMKLYKDLSKKLWFRWRKMYKRSLLWKNELVVEYFSKVWIELAYRKAKAIYTKIFSVDVDKKDIKFIEKEDLKWWIKVYFDDSMIDLSFSKIDNFIKG